MAWSRGLGKKSFGGRWSQQREEKGRDRDRRGYPGPPAKQDRQRKDGASKGRCEQIGPILVLPSSCGPELAAPQSFVSAAAPGAGLWMRENVRRMFSNFLPSPSLALKTRTEAFWSSC